MNQQVVIVTGAAGFLGSAITVDLSCGHRVVAVDWREPTAALREAAPGATWHQADIADANTVASVFRQSKETFGRIDFVVHFAAFYHFGTRRHAEYQRTNVEGTCHVLRCAAEGGAKRLIFASSIAAMQPPPPGEALTEKTPTADYIPYAESKSLGEQMLREASGRLPAAVLRIGGAFSDWSELPPLTSLIRLWAGSSLLSRLMVGRGRTGIPYIHRADVARIVRASIDRHQRLDPCEVFLASQHGAVLHRDLFAAIHQASRKGTTPQPIRVTPRTARLGLCIRRALGCLTGNLPYERPWMLQYVDRPWVADTTYTRNKLGWRCTDGMGVLDRIPTILDRFKQDRRTWERRNRMRDKRRYSYCGKDSPELPV